MVPNWSRRNILQATGITFAVGFSGCSTALGRSIPQAANSLGATDYDPILDGQPTPEDGVPTVWGMIFAHPNTARELINWRSLASPNSTITPGAEFRSFDPDEQFMSVVIGVLPTGYGLKGYEKENESVLGDIIDDFRARPSFEDGQLRFEVGTFQAFSPDPDTPSYHYDYTFTLWNLNGHDRPDEIVVNLHPA